MLPLLQQPALLAVICIALLGFIVLLLMMADWRREIGELAKEIRMLRLSVMAISASAILLSVCAIGTWQKVGSVEYEAKRIREELERLQSRQKASIEMQE